MAKTLVLSELVTPTALESTLHVALAGNPNSGKTSLFNALTGSRQHVGNYPGVTVERREGLRHSHGVTYRILDLPGTYSLATSSDEERIARDVLLTEEVDVVVCVVDATSLERHLYLVLNLLELGLPVVVALNMIDAARRRGIVVDRTRLSQLLRVPVIETIGRIGHGVEELLEAIGPCAARRTTEPLKVNYGIDVERELERLAGLLKVTDSTAEPHALRRRAMALLESPDSGEAGDDPDGVRRSARVGAARIERHLGDPVEIVIAERRHGASAGICHQVLSATAEQRRDITALIDKVLVHRVVGLPIFLTAMYLVFFLTFTVADPLVTAIDDVFAGLAGWLEATWPSTSFALFRSLVIDGIIGGVGGVLVFLPNIVLLFLSISLLEDSGYMARAAFLMDRIMRSVGLHGKSFIPMLLGFGCSVPAIMATRTIESRRARLTTMLVVPLMSCGARLPIYALIIPAFFPRAWQAPMLWLIYVAGVLLAMGIARLLRSTLFAGEGLPFLMELPPYRLPTVRSVITHMTERAWLYLRKAGTVILAISIVMWALSTFPRLDLDSTSASSSTASAESLGAQQLAHSYAGRIGRSLEPVLAPLGFDWKIGTALVGAFAAKEVFVAQLSIVESFGADENALSSRLRDRLRASYSPLVGLCVMLFCLISSPCMATLAITRRESGSWRWPALQWAGLTVLAWVITAVVYQVGTMFSLGV